MFLHTNPPIHPPNQAPTYGWGILHRFQIFKRNRNILICSSLIVILLIWRVPSLRVGGWVSGWWWNWVGAPPCTCAYTCMHIKHDKHGCLHGGGHFQFPNMFILVFCVCACMHVCVHMSKDTPHAPRCPLTHLPPPQSCREPKSPKVYKS